jgi:hypothetical protein
MRIKVLVLLVGSSDAGVGDELSMTFSVCVVPGTHPLQLSATGPRRWCLAERTDGLSLALIGVVGRSPATVPGISHYFGLIEELISSVAMPPMPSTRDPAGTQSAARLVAACAEVTTSAEAAGMLRLPSSSATWAGVREALFVRKTVPSPRRRAHPAPAPRAERRRSPGRRHRRDR